MDEALVRFVPAIGKSGASNGHPPLPSRTGAPLPRVPPSRGRALWSGVLRSRERGSERRLCSLARVGTRYRRLQRLAVVFDCGTHPAALGSEGQPECQGELPALPTRRQAAIAPGLTRSVVLWR